MKMQNNTTTTNDTTNQTVDTAGDGMIDGIIDMLTGSGEMVLITVAALAIGGLTYFKVPAVREPINMAIAKLTDKHGEEIESILKNHLGATFDKMEYETKKRVKNDVLKKVILASFDHTEKKAQGTVGKLVKDIVLDDKK